MSYKNKSKFQYLTAAWRQTIRYMKIPHFYTPFVLYALVQVVVLIGFVLFNYFPFSKIFLPLQKALYGEPSLHYPNNFIILPNLFDIVNIGLSGIIGIWVLAFATYYFFYFHDKNLNQKTAIKTTLQKFPDLFGIWVVETTLILGVIYVSQLLTTYYPNYITFINFMRVAIAILIMAAFAYAIVIIITNRLRFWDAIFQSFRLFFHHFIPTVMAIAIPIIILQIPIDLILNNTPELVQKLSPELIPILLGGDIVFSIFLNFLVIGTITFFYKNAIATHRIEKSLRI